MQWLMKSRLRNAAWLRGQVTTGFFGPCAGQGNRGKEESGSFLKKGGARPAGTKKLLNPRLSLSGKAEA
jgi:hypothetical protein